MNEEQIRKLIVEWRHGCSCASLARPQDCAECTAALVAAIERELGAPSEPASSESAEVIGRAREILADREAEEARNPSLRSPMTVVIRDLLKIAAPSERDQVIEECAKMAEQWTAHDDGKNLIRRQAAQESARYVRQLKSAAPQVPAMATSGDGPKERIDAAAGDEYPALSNERKPDGAFDALCSSRENPAAYPAALHSSTTTKEPNGRR